MATCDELATQLSGLQSQLNTLETKLDDPDVTCEAANLTGDACILYLKSLGRQAETVKNEIAGIQQQQLLRGCLGQQVITGTLIALGTELFIATDPNQPLANRLIVDIFMTLTFIGNPGDIWNVERVTLEPITFTGGSGKLVGYHGGFFNPADGSMNLNVDINVNVLAQDSEITLCLSTGTIEAGPYNISGVPFDKTGQTITLASAGQFTGGKFDKNYASILMQEGTTEHWPQS